MKELKDLIYVRENLLSKKECKHFIDIHKKEHKLGNTNKGYSAAGIKQDIKNTWDFALKLDPDGFGGTYRYDNGEFFSGQKETPPQPYLKEMINLEDLGNRLVYDYVSSFEGEEGFRLQNSYYYEYLSPQKSFWPAWQIQKYIKNEGHYWQYHVDEGPAGSGWYHLPKPMLATGDDMFKVLGDNNAVRSDGQVRSDRLFVFMIYLNDIEEGGETHFPYLDLKIKPKAGTALLWSAAGIHMMHNGQPPISDDKYIMTNWFCHEPSGVLADKFRLNDKNDEIYTTVHRNNRQTHDPNSAYKTDRILYINVSQKEFDEILNTDNADIPIPKTKWMEHRIKQGSTFDVIYIRTGKGIGSKSFSVEGRGYKEDGKNYILKSGEKFTDFNAWVETLDGQGRVHEEGYRIKKEKYEKCLN